MMDSKAASSLIISTALNGDYNVLRDILQSGRVKIEDVVALDRRRNSVTFGLLLLFLFFHLLNAVPLLLHLNLFPFFPYVFISQINTNKQINNHR